MLQMNALRKIQLAKIDKTIPSHLAQFSKSDSKQRHWTKKNKYICFMSTNKLCPHIRSYSSLKHVNEILLISVTNTV